MYGAIPHTENNYYYLFNFETAIRVKVIWMLKNTSYGNGLVVTFKMLSCICIWQDTGGSRIFFRRGCTRLLLYFNTNKPHSFFFWQNASCIRKPQVIPQGGGAPPAPSPRSALGQNFSCCLFQSIKPFYQVTTLFCLRSKLLAATSSFGEGFSLLLVRSLLVVDKGAEDFAVLALVESRTAFHSSSHRFWLAKNFSYGWSLSLTSVSALCSAG